LGEEHNNHWNRSVAVFLTDKSTSGYSTFNDSLSTVALLDFSDKILINHMYPKPGMIGGAIALISQFKKV